MVNKTEVESLFILFIYFPRKILNNLKNKTKTKKRDEKLKLNFKYSSLFFIHCG